ncbi:hypothetical protein [Saccharothrix sp.]|uniref:hypothetical protein n=1 Tax=Saccharothrix sp. TaxID=1873460 RepID=UPI002811ADA6|nr:hypothetical protein [Saccharothrix sp.]
MLVNHDWEPGVWINGRRSEDPAGTDCFGAFAHSAHTDLITARDTGELPDHVEFTVGATTLSKLWNDDGEPSSMLLTVRINGLATVVVEGAHEALVSGDEAAGDVAAAVVGVEDVGFADRYGAVRAPLDEVDQGWRWCPGIGGLVVHHGVVSSCW